MINTKSALAGLPPGVWDHTGRVSHRGRLSDLPAKPKSLNLGRQYRHPVNVGRYIDEHNEDPKPFIWTKSADKMLVKLNQLNQACESVH